MYEACFRVSLKHASLWVEIFKKVRLKGLLSYLHMYLSNTCRTAANRILRSTSTIPTARKRCCFWVRGLTLFQHVSAQELRKNFAARYTGYFYVFREGDYTFNVDAGDGFRMILGHDACPGQSCATRPADLFLEVVDVDVMLLFYFVISLVVSFLVTSFCYFIFVINILLLSSLGSF